MSMYNFLEYSDNYSKTSGSLMQYCRDEPNTTIKGSESLRIKTIKTGRNPNAGNRKDAEIAVPLK